MIKNGKCRGTCKNLCLKKNSKCISERQVVRLGQVSISPPHPPYPPYKPHPKFVCNSWQFVFKSPHSSTASSAPEGELSRVLLSQCLPVSTIIVTFVLKMRNKH